MTYFHEDQLASTRVVLKDGKAISYRAYPYGEVPQGGLPHRDVRYSAAQFDDSVGLYWMGARIYHPRLMRFLSPDEKDADGFNFQGGNLYAYALNNPISYYDRTGGEAQPGVGTYSGATPAPRQAGWTPELVVKATVGGVLVGGGWAAIGVGLAASETGAGLALAYGGVQAKTSGMVMIAMAVSQANGASYSPQQERMASYIAGGGWARSLYTGSLLLGGDRDAADVAGMLGAGLDLGLGAWGLKTGWKDASGFENGWGSGKGAYDTYSLGVDYSNWSSEQQSKPAPAPRPSPKSSSSGEGGHGKDSWDGWKAEPRPPTKSEDHWPAMDS